AGEEVLVQVPEDARHRGLVLHEARERVVGGDEEDVLDPLDVGVLAQVPADLLADPQRVLLGAGEVEHVLRDGGVGAAARGGRDQGEEGRLAHAYHIRRGPARSCCNYSAIAAWMASHQRGKSALTE